MYIEDELPNCHYSEVSQIDCVININDKNDRCNMNLIFHQCPKKCLNICISVKSRRLNVK